MDFVNELIAQHGMIPVVVGAALIVLMVFSILKGGKGGNGNGNSGAGSTTANRPSTPTPPPTNNTPPSGV